ncbi:acyl-CoA dehydrogenase family protein [Actibacterium sp. D379-3]
MSEISQMVAGTVGEFLSRHAAQGHDTSRGLPDGFMAEFEETGLALTLVPEEQGGVGFDFEVAATVSFLWGYHAGPLAVGEIMLGNQMAALCDRPDLIGRMTLAPTPGPGAPVRAAWFAGAEWVGVPVSTSGKPQLALLPVGSDVSPLDDLAGLAVLELPAAGLSDGTAPRIDLPPGAANLDRSGALLTTAAMLGAMERVTEIVVDYVQTRKQFGRPLTKFQAIQHMIADSYSETVLTRAAFERALSAVAGERADTLDWKIAKAQAARAAGIVAATAHQVMGAIGFTAEHDLHRFTTRLWAWRDRWGRQADFEAELGRMACTGGGAQMWAALTQTRMESET